MGASLCTWVFDVRPCESHDPTDGTLPEFDESPAGRPPTLNRVRSYRTVGFPFVLTSGNMGLPARCAFETMGRLPHASHTYKAGCVNSQNSVSRIIVFSGLSAHRPKFKAVINSGRNCCMAVAPKNVEGRVSASDSSRLRARVKIVSCRMRDRPFGVSPSADGLPMRLRRPASGDIFHHHSRTEMRCGSRERVLPYG